MTGPFRGLPGLIAATSLVALVAGCSQSFDPDLRGGLGGFSTSSAAQHATASRPKPDSRGVITYPNYKVAVAQPGDTVASVAARIGMSSQVLADYNGLQPGDFLHQGAVLVLPSQSGTTSPDALAQMADNALSRSQSQSGSNVTVSTLPAANGQASSTQQSNSATSKKVQPASQEPIRHQVQAGETAYSIARQYGVSVRALADWNGLDSNFTIHQGQVLLIPVAKSSEDTTPPGVGSPTPVPPSANAPLPKDSGQSAAAVQQSANKQAAAISPDLGAEQTKSGKLGYPVQGRIIREYKKGKSDGIDLAAAGGTPVKAAADGTVAAVIQDTDGKSVVVLKHSDGLLTLYSNIDKIDVKKGDKVERGQQIGSLPDDKSAYVHFEVRQGMDAVNPADYLN